MGKNNNPATDNSEKKMTKYDRKMLARKEAELREKRQRRITRITTAAIIALILIVAIAVPVGRKIRMKSEYIRIGGHSVNKIEYDFMYGYFTNYTRSMYTYFGMIDSTKNLSEQQFSETMTWQQYFDSTTVDSIRQCFILTDDAKEKGLTYDVGEQYDEFYTACESDATAGSMTLSKYLQENFGSYATKSSVKNILNLLLTASAHNEYLLEQNKPSEEAIEAYYAENKNSYDTVNYNAFELKAEIAEGASEEEISAAMADAKQKADEFVSRFNSGTTFLALYAEYSDTDLDNASDDASGDSDSDTDASDADSPKNATLNTDIAYSSADVLYRDWLFDEARTGSDITVVEDETDHSWHIVAFRSRQRPDTVSDSISSTLSSRAVSEYIAGKSEPYRLTDKKDHLQLPSVTPVPSPTPDPDATVTPAAE